MNNDLQDQAKSNRSGNTDISAKLKLLYASIEEEGIPDQFLDLLERLDKAEEAATSGKA